MLEPGTWYQNMTWPVTYGVPAISPAIRHSLEMCTFMKIGIHDRNITKGDQDIARARKNLGFKLVATGSEAVYIGYRLRPLHRQQSHRQQCEHPIMTRGDACYQYSVLETKKRSDARRCHVSRARAILGSGRGCAKASLPLRRCLSWRGGKRGRGWESNEISPRSPTAMGAWGMEG